jgi:transcriptional regulator with XRE-family HTH domain
MSKEEEQVPNNDRVRNERFAAAINYILAARIFRSQRELAIASGITPTTISRIKSGGIKNADIKTLYRINAACGGIINIDYINNKSDVMLVKDINKSAMPQSNAELSSYVNSAIASKDETIASLRSELKGKDDLIAELREQIAEKRRDKAQLEEENYRLRRDLDELRKEYNRLRAQVAAEAHVHHPRLALGAGHVADVLHVFQHLVGVEFRGYHHQFGIGSHTIPVVLADMRAGGDACHMGGMGRGGDAVARGGYVGGGLLVGAGGVAPAVPYGLHASLVVAVEGGAVAVPDTLV